MIKSLQIQNFQSHKNTKLEFKPGVNILVGTSDSGKTAILRALRWGIENRPLGDAFRSHWGGDTCVIIEADDCKVERFKGKQDHYILAKEFEKQESEIEDIDVSGTGKLEFKAFGTEPPEEITQALNLSELNIQGQMDSAFLISNNPGEVSRHFNKIANIDKIDSALKAVESWVRSINQNVKATESEIERYENDLAEFEYLDKLEAEVESLEQLEEQRNRASNKVNQLSTLMEKIEDTEDLLQERSVLLPAEKPVDKLLDMFQKRAQTVKEYKDLKAICLRLIETHKQVKDFQALVNDQPVVDEVLTLFEDKEGLQKDINSLESVIIKNENLTKEVGEARQILDDLEEQWHQHAPETCPLCEGKGTL